MRWSFYKTLCHVEYAILHDGTFRKCFATRYYFEAMYFMLITKIVFSSFLSVIYGR